MKKLFIIIILLIPALAFADEFSFTMSSPSTDEELLKGEKVSLTSASAGLAQFISDTKKFDSLSHLSHLSFNIAKDSSESWQLDLNLPISALKVEELAIKDYEIYFESNSPFGMNMRKVTADSIMECPSGVRSGRVAIHKLDGKLDSSRIVPNTLMMSFTYYVLQSDMDRI